MGKITTEDIKFVHEELEKAESFERNAKVFICYKCEDFILTDKYKLAFSPIGLFKTECPNCKGDAFIE